MSETAYDRVAREDVVLFVNAAIASTGQAEFHAGAAEQRLSLAFLHAYVLGNYRELYASTLALDLNHHNAALVIGNLLRTRNVTALEGRLIAARLRLLPPQRVYRLFDDVRRDGVNNRRTRAIMRDWVAARPDLAFDVVKYRRRLASVARHAHLRLPGEAATALFDWRRPARYQTPILETWRAAHYKDAALVELPYTVAEGLAASRGLDRKRFLTQIAPRLTAAERLRLRSASSRAGAPVPALDGPLDRLVRYALSLPRPERKARRAELDAALRAAAARVVGRQRGTWGRVVSVLDDSYSASGSAQRRRHPLAVALGVHYLVDVLAGDHTALWLGHRGDRLLVHPVGATPLGDRLLDALEQRPDRVVVVSDGYDNAPPGQAAEVLRVWYRRLDRSRRVEVVHLNPVYDAAGLSVRRLAAEVATVGIRDAADAPALVELARFATGDADFAELSGYLSQRVGRFLAGAS